MSKLTVFVSSTIKDFGPVRRDLAEWFRRRGVEARLSELNDFPVARGVHSHDACLHAIRGSNLFVMLIGNRYGGRYKGTPKSITWREYDEAYEARIPCAVLVLRSTNELAQGKKGKGDELPRDFERVVQLIDHVRRRDRDNWTYLEWDGSATEAEEIIQTTLNHLLVQYQAPHGELLRGAERAAAAGAAMRDLCDAAHDLAGAARRGTMAVEDALATLLRFGAARAGKLLGFEPADLWNLMLYRRDGDVLVPWIRECHPAIERHGRRWKVGDGHVGLSVKALSTLVAGDISLAEGFVPGFPTDANVYRSVISMPLRRPKAPGKKSAAADVVGAFVVTSSRLDHFADARQPEVLAAEQIGAILSIVAGCRDA